MTFYSSGTRFLLSGLILTTATACAKPLDLDFRGAFGNAPSTADAARQATAPRPEPDARGIISYPGYQVAVARRDDTLSTLAARIGADPLELAKYNGIQINDNLRENEIIALPSRVDESAGGPIRPSSGLDITAIAGSAIDAADTSQIETATLPPAQTGVEPIRHQVQRGETAFSIARLYNVSIRSLAGWNGLDSGFSVREGQYLLIPVALPGSKVKPFDATDTVETTELPGAGTPTPTPPSASKPLPDEKTVPVSEPVESNAAPDLSQQSAAAGEKPRMEYPVRGDIIREYSKGKNDGIDIAANPGTPVKAAADGVVAAITEDTNGTPIVVIKHPNNLLTLYSNVSDVSVQKGTNVTRSQSIAKVPSTGAAAIHFEVRRGFESLDPIPFLN